MSSEVIAVAPAKTPARRPRPVRRLRVVEAAPAIVLRAGKPADAEALHQLIEAHLAEGHLLPRSKEELERHAARFVVAVVPRSRGRREQIVGCAELAPLSERVAEVRSLVVDRPARAQGVGRQLVGELRRIASRSGFRILCAFTHDAGYFVRKGFSIVPHQWLPEKIAADCVRCPLFRACGQHAVMLTLNA
jgi:amino-acid N-acetyltransferase